MFSIFKERDSLIRCTEHPRNVSLIRDTYRSRVRPQFNTKSEASLYQLPTGLRYSLVLYTENLLSRL